MKKYLLIVLAGMIAVTACQQEKTIEPEITPEPSSDGPGLVPMTFKASLEDLATKSDIQNDFILWEDSDMIAIFDGSELREFTVSALSPSGKGAEFSGSAASVSEYYAVAPYEAATNLSTANTRISVTIPHNQTIIGSHCVDSKALVSTGVASGTADLNFENQFSLMKVTVTSSNIMGITVMGNNNESIAGTSHFYYDGEGAPKIDLSNAGQKKINLTYKATSSSDVSAFPPGDYYIAIWPTEFSKGYSIVMTDEEGGMALRSTSTAQSLTRNGGQALGVIDDGVFCPPVIMNADQLKAWRRLASKGIYAEGDEVKLGADIDLDGYNWTPVEQFIGIFDGQGHKIYNFSVNSSAQKVGFIANLGDGSAEAVLKNVVFGSSDGTSADGSSSIKIAATSGWAYAGIVAHVRNKASMQGVTNFVPVTGLADMTVKHRIAGIAGMIGNEVTISNCHNWADVYDRSACDTGEGSSVAGVVGGWGGSDSELIGCTNHGQIYNYCTGVPYVAGIIGYTMGDGMLIEDCHNLKNGSKEISNETASTRDTDKFGSLNWSILTGGIVGVVGKNVTINKCTNTMNVYGKSTSTNNCRACVGGIAGGCIRNGSSIKGCSNTASETRSFSTLSTPITCGGIIGFIGNSSDMVVTKAEDDTWTTNSCTIAQTTKMNNNVALYYGGIVGLLNSKNAVVSYCRNTGKITSYASQATNADKATFCGAGICGSAIGTITYCINDGIIYNTSGGEKVIFYSGGICGDTDAPKEISYCTNNGPVSVYSSNGGTATGGILSQLTPGKTIFKYNTNTGFITTGNLNSWPTRRSIQNIEVSIGALIGKIEKPTAEATICEGCIVACDLTVAQTYDKWGYTGLVPGEVHSKDGWDYKVTVGTASNPVQIVNTTKVNTGTNANPTVETNLDTITTLSLANKYFMGTKNALYDASDGVNDTSKMELNLSIVTAAQAGIE